LLVVGWIFFQLKPKLTKEIKEEMVQAYVPKLQTLVQRLNSLFKPTTTTPAVTTTATTTTTAAAAATADTTTAVESVVSNLISVRYVFQHFLFVLLFIIAFICGCGCNVS
jgi:hypothetical protein